MADKPKDVDPPKKKSGKLKWIILILVFLLLAGGGAGGYWWFMMRPAMLAAEQAKAEPPKPEKDEKVEKGEKPAPAVRKDGKVAPLPPFLVNLSDPAGRRYLKLSMEVEVNAPEATAEIQAQSAKVRDAVILLLSSKTYAELNTPEGKLQIKNEVAARLNQILGAPRIVRVYFTEFVIQ